MRGSTDEAAGQGAPAPLRWGLAGTGDLARRRLAPAFASVPGQLRCVWGRRSEPAAGLAARWGARSTTCYQDMLAEVDAVYIATPVASHVPLALAAVRAGRHVLIEKPLAAGTAPAAALLEEIDRAGVRAGVAYYRRLWPTLRALRSLIARGDLGRPIHARVRFGARFVPDASDPQAWRLDRAIAGAGVLADAGSHRLDLLLWLFGQPSRVDATLGDVTEGGCERRADVRLRWAGGMAADCGFDWNAEGEDSFHVAMAEGTAVLDRLDGGEMTVRGKDGRAEVITGSNPINPYVGLIDNLTRAVRDGSEIVCRVADALAVDAVIGRAQASGWSRAAAVPAAARHGRAG